MVGPICDVLLLVNDVNVGYDILHINIYILMYPHGNYNYIAIYCFYLWSYMILHVVVFHIFVLYESKPPPALPQLVLKAHTSLCCGHRRRSSPTVAEHSGGPLLAKVTGEVWHLTTTAFKKRVGHPGVVGEKAPQLFASWVGVSLYL